jgi:hypothetical protein
MPRASQIRRVELVGPVPLGITGSVTDRSSGSAERSKLRELGESPWIS